MEENKEALLKELIGTPEFGETVKDYLKNNENGKTIFKSLTDSSVAKGIDTWKSNNLQKLLDEEINKRFPAETEEAKMIRAMKAENEQFRNEMKREKLLNNALKIATEKGLPVKIIDKFLGDDDETTLSNIAELETIFREALTKEVENKFKDNGRTPVINPNGNDVNEDNMSWGEILKKHNIKA